VSLKLWMYGVAVAAVVPALVGCASTGNLPGPMHIRRRAAELREAAQVWERRKSEPLVAREPESRLLPAQSAPRPRGWWECDLCGRGFHGYGAYLNHRCDSDD
jgi:hypothetical protein